MPLLQSAHDRIDIVDWFADDSRAIAGASPPAWRE